jgi:hypothetical protein
LNKGNNHDNIFPNGIVAHNFARADDNPGNKNVFPVEEPNTKKFIIARKIALSQSISITPHKYAHE